MSIIKKIDICSRTLTIHEHVDTSDSATGRVLTGTWLWDSALVLANWMQNFDLAGKTVLELGAGTGLPGLTAAVLGAERVVLTDIAPILPGLEKNVAVNALQDRVEVRELVWGLNGDEIEVEEVDVVLMSDVFYDADEMRALARTLKGVCRERTRVWAASEVRSSTEKCLEMLAYEGFQAEEVEVSTRELVGCSKAEGSAAFAVYVVTCSDVVCEVGRDR